MVPVKFVREMPMAEVVEPLPYWTMVRFGDWDAILKEPAPSAELEFTSGMWHYSRGFARAEQGNLELAEREKQQLDALVKEMPKDLVVGLTPARDLLTLASAVLAGEMAAARGDKDDALGKLARAVRLQDGLPYDEPPAWYFPVREMLGAELLAAGKAAQAEKVYHADLRINPGNPRSLYGLAMSLKAQGRIKEAAQAKQQFAKSWAYADKQASPMSMAAISDPQ
jgi:tetratricopeptide (TPR) repeat protein